MSRALSLMVLLVAGSVVGWGISVDPGIIFNTTTGTIQTTTTAVGIPIEVTSPITLFGLGAFDYQGDGIQGSTEITVNVRPFNPSSYVIGSPISGASVTLSSASPLAYGSVWGYLPNSVTLAAGWYVIYATGFDGNNPVIGGLGASDTTTQSFGGAVNYGLPTTSPVGTLYGIYTNNGWVFSNLSQIHISGGTFGVPEPSTYALMGTVGLALYLFRRRKLSAKKG